MDVLRFFGFRFWKSELCLTFIVYSPPVIPTVYSTFIIYPVTAFYSLYLTCINNSPSTVDFVVPLFPISSLNAIYSVYLILNIKSLTANHTLHTEIFLLALNVVTPRFYNAILPSCIFHFLISIYSFILFF